MSDRPVEEEGLFVEGNLPMTKMEVYTPALEAPRKARAKQRAMVSLTQAQIKPLTTDKASDRIINFFLPNLWNKTTLCGL